MDDEPRVIIRSSEPDPRRNSEPEPEPELYSPSKAWSKPILKNRYNAPQHRTNQRSRSPSLQHRVGSPTLTRSDGGRSSLNQRMGQSTLEEHPAMSARVPSTARYSSNKRALDDRDTVNSLHDARRLKSHNQPRSPSPQQSPEDPAQHTPHQLKSAASPDTTQASSRYQTPGSPPAQDEVKPIEVVPDPPPASQIANDTTEQPFIKQPITRPISEPQLINEVKGIYAGLVMVEKKCVEIVTQQQNSTKRLEDQQWKALVALHRTLLQEHHDFFSASQHPTASDALKKLAVKYAMPARMWRHGIHAFLELLRHRLPGSMEHMLNFIYLSYSMMALLKESVPSFVETWIECLGDLARYRMAIEDSDPRDRETWANVARMWYNEAADKSPNVGRIQHHLAVLARPNIVEQLFYYTKAVVSVVPFVNARESIMLLFDLFLKTPEGMRQRYPAAESSFVHAFAILFVRQSVSDFYLVREQFKASFTSHIERIGPALKETGPQIALALISGLLDFGHDDSHLWNLCRKHAETIGFRRQLLLVQSPSMAPVVAESQIRQLLQREEFDVLKSKAMVNRVAPPLPSDTEGMIPNSDSVVSLAGVLFADAISICASKIGDKNIVTFMHAILANLWGLSFVPGALPFIEACVPWNKITEFLNTLGRSGVLYSNIESETFPPSQGGSGRQLPDDFYLRGYITTQYYFPPDYWTGPLVDEDERNVELPSHQAPRAERCLWLGVRIASLNRYMIYDDVHKQFDHTPYAEVACAG